ncbi:hypothetical protein [Bacillus pumilus]|uniref:hypothetical protein n=1 Tax=Bacillus pumilus TaxID=1408 RepID=UPI001C22D85D|nr:hypothetical protein [Bacillus pumilus]MBU8697013.1 hypothetical protein [Bacillus pumilus]
MSNSKKDSEILFKLFHNFVQNMTNSQYESLINGFSEIKVVEKNININDEYVYLNILSEVNSESTFEGKQTLIKKKFSQKNDLIQLAKFIDIQVKSRDTIDELINKIIPKAEELKGEIDYKLTRENTKEENLSHLSLAFENSMDAKEARDLIVNSPLYSNKNELLKFARTFDVYPDRGASIDSIVDALIKSVVEAKLRSYKIRQKL